MNSEINIIFEQIVDVYRCLCYEYVRTVGKLGAQYNTVAYKWFKGSTFSKEMSALLRQLKKAAEGVSRDEKYEILLELYAIKPGIHEAFFRNTHEGEVLKRMRDRMLSGYGPQSVGEATYMLKSLVCVENLEGSGRPFSESESLFQLPYTSDNVQDVTRYYLDMTDWRSLDELRPIGSWDGYANCAIDEGPLLINRQGQTRNKIHELVKTSNIVGYDEVLVPYFKSHNEGVWASGYDR